MCKGEHTLIERFEGWFAAERIANENSYKVHHIVVTETATGKAHSFSNGIKYAEPREMVRNDRHLLEYVIMPPFLIVWYVDLDIAARRPVVVHPLPSHIFARACFCPGARL